MKSRIVGTGIFLLLLTGNLTVSGVAQGVIIIRPPREIILPRPAPLPPREFLPMPMEIRTVSFDSNIHNQAAKTRVTQVFFNPTPYVLEGTFLFPLPEEASVSEFILYEGEKKLRGVIMDREEARRTYESIVREVRDPGLLEYAGKNLFEARIFPILPRSEKKLELEYTQVLRADNDLVRFSYPLGVGLKSAGQSIGNAAGRISIQSRVPIKNVYSPTHAISLKRDGENRISAGFESKQPKSGSDFVLYFSFSDREFGASLLTYRAPGENGYFMLLLSPKPDMRADEVSQKDIVFVLDVSGSMNDRGKLEKAQQALRYGIQSLNSNDRFNLVTFSTEENTFDPQLLAADAANKNRAYRYLQELKAGGGTNIYDALSAALRLFPVGSDRPQYMIFLTDGLPTVGETNMEPILNRVQSLAKERLRLFAFGVGYDVNAFLLDQLSGRHGGVTDYVTPDEDLELKVSSFFDKVNYPVLADVHIEIPGVSLSELYPRQIPDLFKGMQISLMGRYQGEGRHPIEIAGQYQNRKRTFRFESQDFPQESYEADFMPRLWASRKVGYLLDQIRLRGESAEVREEVIRLAKKYGFVTPYTSYLAAEDRRYARSPVRVFTRPDLYSPGSPADAMDSTSASAPSAREQALASVTGQVQSGEGAVRTSKILQEMKEQEQVSSEGQVRIVGDKTFLWKENAWVDSSIEANPHLKVVRFQFGQEEYFQLLKSFPALARYLAIGESVSVLFENKVYEIRK